MSVNTEQRKLAAIMFTDMVGQQRAFSAQRGARACDRAFGLLK